MCIQNASVDPMNEEGRAVQVAVSCHTTGLLRVFLVLGTSGLIPFLSFLVYRSHNATEELSFLKKEWFN